MKVFQFHISLENINPLIWRRIQMEEGAYFSEFHLVIQTIFGWEDYHLWEFSDRDIRIGAIDLLEDDDVQPDHTLKLKDVFSKRGQKMNYQYDFGDSWDHTIKLEKIQEAVPEKKYPVLMDGEHVGPPEDSGGIPGYSYMLEVLKDPKHPEHEQYLDWLGGENPLEEHLDIDGVNMELSRLKANSRGEE